MLDLNRPVTTRRGNAVEILRTNLRSEDGYSVAGIVNYPNGTQEVHAWQKDGSYIRSGAETTMDLVNVARVHTSWAVWTVFGDAEPAVAITCTTEEDAKLWVANYKASVERGSRFGRVFAIQKRTVTEGEGL